MANAPIVVPPLGESVARVRVTKWLKPVGARVEADELVVAIATDKIDVELAAPISGTLAIHVAEGELVAIGAAIGEITPG